mgnify:CR=1 FL=1
MTKTISVIALTISIVGFLFNIYQYRIMQKIRVVEKATSLIRFSKDIRRKSADLQYKIDATDHAPEAEFLEKVNSFVDECVPRLSSSQKLSLQDLFQLELQLISVELEIDLFYKLVNEVDRFNEEVRKSEEV